MNLPKREDFELISLSSDHLDFVLEWRNSDRVRMNMFEYHPIVKKNHLQWFESLKNSTTSKCWICLFRKTPFGVITIKQVNAEKDSWIWGCYLGPEKLVFQAGTIMGYLALEKYFEDLKVAQVIGEAVSANKRSLEFNARLGFRTENQFIRTNSKSEKIPATYLEMNQSEWPNHKKRLLKLLFSN